MSFFRVLAGGLVILMGAGAAVWWTYGRSIEVSTVAAERGTAAEIVYATGAVEPVRWAKVASLIRDRIVEICVLRGQVRRTRATCSRASTTARCARS